MVGSSNSSPTTPARYALTTPKAGSPCPPFASQGRGSVSGMASPLPTFSRAGGDSFSFWGNSPPLLGQAKEVVAAEPSSPFNKDPNDLVVTTREGLVVNHLIVHDFLSAVELDSLLEDLDRVPLSEKAPIFNESFPIVGRPRDSGTNTHSIWHLWGCQPPQAQPPQAPGYASTQNSRRSCA